MKTLAGYLKIAGSLLLCLSVTSGIAQTPPTLEIELLEGPDMRLSWTHPNAVVEENEQLLPADWRVLDADPVHSNGRFIITVTPLEEQRFYRLRVIDTGVLPPDPVEVAPELSSTGITDFQSTTEFLYSGPNPIQTGVAPGTIEFRRAAVLRGKVLHRDNSPFSGVTISVLNHPELGRTLSREDGMFDLAVNGGGFLTVNYDKEGYCPAQRQIQAPWQGYACLPDVVMIQMDPIVTPITFGEDAPQQVARGSVQADEDGERQATLFFPAGTCADLVMPDGTVVPCDGLNVRATEFTVGPNGPAAMPGELPPSSGYTYAVELSADEAVAAGAMDVRFDRPIFHYVENFLEFPAGSIVPTGYYDRRQGQWIASENGRVIHIVSVTGGLVNLDTDGDGVADDGADLGVTDAERRELAALYQAGQSLWRVPIPHFTPWDCNWPYGPPEDAVPPEELPEDDKPVDLPCKGGVASTVEFQNQVLAEAIPIVGTPFSLHYSSARVSGRRASYTLNIPLSGASVPASLKRIELEIEVAGRTFNDEFPPVPNQRTTFVWDRKDAYGRTLQGSQPVTVRIGYVYPAVYLRPAEFARSFAQLSGVPITGSRARQEITLYLHWQGTLGGWDAQGMALGGWTLNEHHVYDPVDRVLHFGYGGRRSAQAMSSVINTVATGGARGLAFGADGSLYIASPTRVRRLAPDGTLTTVAGTGTSGFAGDGGPATEARLRSAFDVAIGADGSLYIPDDAGRRIRRISPGADGMVTGAPDEIITTIAGVGIEGTTGDGGPATEARIQSAETVAVAPDGSVYIGQVSNNNRVRRVDPSGIITTFAGTGTSGTSGDGGPATQARVSVQGIATGPDGSLYIVSGISPRVRRVSPDGIINLVFRDAGQIGIAVDRDGTIYTSHVQTGRNHIYRATPDGIVTILAGAGPNGFSGDGGPPAQARLRVPWGIAIGPDGSVYFADDNNNRVRKIGPSLTGLEPDESLIAAEDGSEAYVFLGSRHLRTLDALTGAVRYQFGYDDAGQLTQVTDAHGSVTVIERNAGGEPVAVVSPFGQRTTLGINANGYLSSITSPANETVQVSYTAHGLLTAFTDARGHRSEYAYDELGRLNRTEDAAGAVQTFARIELRTEQSRGFMVARRTALDRVTTYQVEELANGDEKRINTFPSGEHNELLLRNNRTSVLSFPDGSTVTEVEGPDPRFGMQSPLNTSATVAASPTVQASLTTRRGAQLSVPRDPLSVQTLTETNIINGRAFRSRYDAASRTMTFTSAAGRQGTLLLNEQGEVVSMEAPGIETVHFTYDEQGRLLAVTQGSGDEERRAAFEYEARGYLRQTTDPFGRATAFDWDDAERLTKTTLPDLRELHFEYDANGNPIGLTPPGRPAHTFAYDAVNLPTGYAPPDAGLPGHETTYAFNLDRQLTQIIRPDGQTINLSYGDDGNCDCGRLAEVVHPLGVMTYDYDPVTGQLTAIAGPGDSTLGYVYDGALLTGATWGGAVTGRVDRAWNNDFQVASITVNGLQTISWQYDPDGLMTGAGDLEIARHPQLGLITGTTLGPVATARSYNGFAEPADYSVTFNAAPVFSVAHERDKLGRTTQRTETIQGVTDTFVYTYDTADRLVEVKKNGVLQSSYAYDANDNRLTWERTTENGPLTTAYAYDAQDRLLSVSTPQMETLCTYTANGELRSKTVGGQATEYEYDALGNLLALALPDGTQIEYLVDGRNRRIGKRLDGARVQGFLYADQLKPVAELDGNNDVVSLFVYATGVNVPAYMIRGLATYRIITDHLGSPRLVVDVATGQVVQRMDYDEFGRVVLDTNPGFQPFGFAGGLYDSDTGLVRFGARDYDAETGRWTAKDPILFAGGDSNLYAYAGNDPVNLIDPFGAAPTPKVIVDWGFESGDTGRATGSTPPPQAKPGNPGNLPLKTKLAWEKTMRWMDSLDRGEIIARRGGYAGGNLLQGEIGRGYHISPARSSFCSEPAAAPRGPGGGGAAALLFIGYGLFTFTETGQDFDEWLNRPATVRRIVFGGPFVSTPVYNAAVRPWLDRVFGRAR